MISRKLKLRKFAGLLFAAIAVTTFYSCSNEDDNLDDQNARITVRMTDAPGDYEAVFVHVIDVMVQTDATAGGDEGWTSLENVETGTYNLLELTGGITQLLANAEIPAGPLSQIRLVLGDDNTVVIDGESQPLSTPSAQQSGLKLQVNQTLEAGQQYDFLLDFNVDQSVVSAGSSGGFILKPVIRVSTSEGTGVITGEVQPSNRQSLVKASNANNTISAYTDASGKFALHGVPAGTYQVSVTTEAAAGLQVKTVNNVVVTSGQEIDTDVIFLE